MRELQGGTKAWGRSEQKTPFTLPMMEVVSPAHGGRWETIKEIQIIIGNLCITCYVGIFQGTMSTMLLLH